MCHELLEELKRQTELKSKILMELKKQTELFKEMGEVMKSWQIQDKYYHAKTLGE